MRILRSLSRRGSSTESIGFYTVLTPSRWFAASRLPDNVHHFGSRFIGPALTAAPKQNAPNQAGSKETTTQSNFMKLSAQDHRPVRTALVVSAAIAITLLILWWIMSGAPSNAY
jgi:hypothetical protein